MMMNSMYIQNHWMNSSDECEQNGWEFITGGFLDRIGEGWKFPTVNKDTNIWETFPYSGFFRYPLSRLCLSQ